MAGSRDGRGQNDLVAEFNARIERLQRNGVSTYPPRGGKMPWAEASEERKLGEIVRESWRYIRGLTVPGNAVLEAIERNVDYAGLAPGQPETLRSLRAGIDSGTFEAGGPVRGITSKRPWPGSLASPSSRKGFGPRKRTIASPGQR